MPRTEREVRTYDAENHRVDTAATVGFLADLAGNGDILEFGVGTGRLLLPLASRCEHAVGVDLSADMVAAVRGSNPPPNVEIHHGDMRTWKTQHKFSIVICVFNTLLEIPSRQGQLDAVTNAASMVAPGGHLVIENFHPPIQSMAAGRRVVPLDLPGIDFGLVTQTFDWRSQMVDQRIMYVSESEVRVRRLTIRLLFPSELDLMAQMAGLTLSKRMSNWRGTPWHADRNDPEVSNVISLYHKG